MRRLCVPLGSSLRPLPTLIPTPSRQKEILYHKMREEQVRRWQVWFNAQPAIKPRTQKLKFADFSVLFDDSGEDKVRR